MTNDLILSNYKMQRLIGHKESEQWNTLYKSEHVRAQETIPQRSVWAVSNRPLKFNHP